MMDTQCKKSHLGFIDTLKGIAIILVVFGHFYPAGMQDGVYAIVHKFIYSFHMPLFMVISGYLFAHTRQIETWQMYLAVIKKQLTRLLVPYFVLSLCIMTIKLIVQQFIPLENPVTSDFWKYLFLNPVGGFATFLWYLYTLFGIYILFPPLMLLLKSTWLLLVILFGLVFIPLPSFFCLNLISRFLIYFFLGIVLYKHFEVAASKIIKNILLGLLMFALCFLINFSGKAEWVSSYVPVRLMALLASICGVMGCWFLIAFFCSFRKLNLILEMLGISSAAIYLFHTMAMAPVKFLLSEFMFTGPMAFMLTVVLVNTAGLVVPLFIEKCIGRSHTLALLLLGALPRRK